MKRKFVIEYEVDDESIQEWVENERRELVLGEGEEITWTPVDLIASNWATGEGPDLTVTRAEEIK